ncbi:MAG: protein kinase, partial [Acidobacteriota bacterium]
MAMILVVEPDADSAGSIQATLAAAGHQVVLAADRADAVSRAASTPPALVIASATAPEARSLTASFSREAGGPGSVVLVPQGQLEIAADFQADGLLGKPIRPNALQRVVTMLVGTADSPVSTAPPISAAVIDTPAATARLRATPPNDQMSARDIFGDMLAEVERDAEARTSKKRSRESGPSVEKRLHETLSGVLDIPGVGAPPRKKRRKSSVDRKLEETLSGILPDQLSGAKPSTAARSATRQPAAAAQPVSTQPAAPAAAQPAASQPAAPAQPAAAQPAAAQPAASQSTAAAPAPTVSVRPPMDEALHVDPSLLTQPVATRPSADSRPPAAAPAPDAAQPAAAASAPAQPAPAQPSTSQPPAAGDAAIIADTDFGEDEIDALLNKTLAGLRGSGGKSSRAARAARTAAGPTRADAAASAQPAAAPAAEAQPAASPAQPAASPAQPTAPPAQPAAPPAQPAARSDHAPIETAPVEPNDEGPPPVLLADGSEVDFREHMLRTQELPALSSIGPAGAADATRGTFGPYALIERIAIGGMAEVWKAQRSGVEGFQKTVAIKRILAHLTDNPEFVTMFIDEAKLAAQLSHGNIIQIHDLGKVDDEHYIAMEFVDGKDLRSILQTARKREMPMPIGLAMLIAAQLASALDYAHRKRGFDGQELGLVHRDISPQNVLISHEGDVKLCDFGIVKAVAKASTTQMGALKGKLQYMSPEQAWGQSVDGRSDIFSLGAVFFEMLTGRKLFTGDSEISVLDAVRECRIQPPRGLNPTVPEAVERVVLRALTRERDDRYATAGAMETDLQKALQALDETPNALLLANYMRQLFVDPAPVVYAPGRDTATDAAAASSAIGDDVLHLDALDLDDIDQLALAPSQMAAPAPTEAPAAEIAEPPPAEAQPQRDDDLPLIDAQPAADDELPRIDATPAIDDPPADDDPPAADDPLAIAAEPNRDDDLPQIDAQPAADDELPRIDAQPAASPATDAADAAPRDDDGDASGLA